MELQQIPVDERDRGACQGVESSLCNGLELLLAGVTLVYYANPADFGGHSLRVGGASDFRDLFDCSTAGLEEAERVLKKRGRWRSDIPVAFIYTRASLATALEASARLAHVDGGDIEASFSAWAEPAI